MNRIADILNEVNRYKEEEREAMDMLRQARANKRMIETDLIQELVNQNMIDCLKVDYNLLRRYM